MEPVVDEWMYGVLRELGFSVETADVWDRWVVLGFIVAIAFVSDFVCRQLLLRVVKRIVARTKATWDDILFEDRVLRRLCHIVPPVLIYFLLPLAFPPESGMVAFVLKLLLIYVIAVVLRFVNAFLKALHDVADQKEELQGKPLKGLMQTGQVIAFFVCIILIISILIDQVAGAAAGRAGRFGSDPDVGLQGQHHGTRVRYPVDRKRYAACGRLDLDVEIRRQWPGDRSDAEYGESA